MYNKKIAIIGVGFMGGSLACALKKKYPKLRISGFARSEKSLKLLSKLAIVDEVSLEIKEVVLDSDIVALALPVERIVEYFKVIKPYLKPGAIVFDLGSTKSEIEKKPKLIVPKTNYFVPCHPLAGSEKSGPRFSNPDLYKESLCVITASRSKKATLEIKALWESLGSRVIFMDSDRHDEIFCALSHFPHLLSFALTEFVPKEYAQYAPRSIRDLTRISNSPPRVWAEIFLANKKNLKNNIREFKRIIALFEKNINNSDREGLIRLLEQINKKQSQIQTSDFKSAK